MTAGEKFVKESRRKSLFRKGNIHSSEEGIESAKINTEETKCQFCNFKAHYKFHRCPECQSEQK